jgi:hypothetical protein
MNKVPGPCESKCLLSSRAEEISLQKVTELLNSFKVTFFAELPHEDSELTDKQLSALISGRRATL